MIAETVRLNEAREGKVNWKKWGPYLSERQWGTVREDYSEDGNAWDYFTHDQARSRAYRWGEDGIAGISDDNQRLCFALALWNGTDPILKERLFGLTNSEGNHGEDVKEYYFYLDSTPTPLLHEVPLQVSAGGIPVRRPGGDEPHGAPGTRWSMSSSTPASSTTTATSTSLWSTPKAVRRTSWCRSPLSTGDRKRPSCTCCRRSGSATTGRRGCARPAARNRTLKQIKAPAGTSAVAAAHPVLGEYTLYCEGDVPLLFTENETNNERLFPDYPNASPYVKDGINNCVVLGQTGGGESRQARARRSRPTTGCTIAPASRRRCGCA